VATRCSAAILRTKAAHFLVEPCARGRLFRRVPCISTCPLLLYLQNADLGAYGTFELEISVDDGTMTWKSDPANVAMLAEDLYKSDGIFELCASITKPTDQPSAAPSDVPSSSPGAACDLEFILFNADDNVPVGPLPAMICLEDHPFEFNIQALASDGCPETHSAYMDISGPISLDRVENLAPYMIFGDQGGLTFNGRKFREGYYTISSTLYSKRRLAGDLVVEGSFDFTVKKCYV